MNWVCHCAEYISSISTWPEPTHIVRERIAIAICLIALGLSVGLSGLFGVRHNPVTEKRDAIAPQPALVPSKTNISTEAGVALPHRGLAVFEEQKCATCHSLAGKGNPRYPLDGIGSRMIAGELEQWITATGPAQAKLSSMVVRRKERYRMLPPRDMTALVEYLTSLKAEDHSTEVP